MKAGPSLSPLLRCLRGVCSSARPRRSMTAPWCIACAKLAASGVRTSRCSTLRLVGGGARAPACVKAAAHSSRAEQAVAVAIVGVSARRRHTKAIRAQRRARDSQVASLHNIQMKLRPWQRRYGCGARRDCRTRVFIIVRSNYNCTQSAILTQDDLPACACWHLEPEPVAQPGCPRRGLRHRRQRRRRREKRFLRLRMTVYPTLPRSI